MTAIAATIPVLFPKSSQHYQYREAYRGSTPSLIDVLKPFGKGGTASFPGHRFFMSYEEDDDPEEVQIRFIVGKPPNNIYVFDPYYVQDDEEATAANLEILDEEELELYNGMRKTLLFNEVYREATGRSYLANYPKKPSDHHMWRADYFGQTHWTTTRETHFTSMPPSDSLGYISTQGRARVLTEDDPRGLAEYRSGEPFLNMTLRVMSCAPRVFEIRNFLSPTEVKHILTVAAGEELSASTTGIGNDFEREEDATRRTRSSFNSWIERERSPILDAIYRRAADLLHIDESLFRRRDKEERPDLEDRNTISESLQLVHYDIGQEYTAHHDFGYSDQDSEHQSQRYCTLLLYLNEGMSGGSTSFPRWVNAETFEELRAIPEVGKAVLFYNQLPDGNPDDLSQHQANPIYDGEKWLINLWVWSPYHK